MFLPDALTMPLTFVMTYSFSCLVQSASQVHAGQFVTGFVDGSVKLFDIRMPEM